MFERGRRGGEERGCEFGVCGMLFRYFWSKFVWIDFFTTCDAFLLVCARVCMWVGGFGSIVGSFLFLGCKCFSPESCDWASTFSTYFWAVGLFGGVCGGGRIRPHTKETK